VIIEVANMPTYRETIGAQVVALVLAGCLSGRGEGPGADEPGQSEGEQSDDAQSDGAQSDGAQSEGGPSGGERSDEGQTESGPGGGEPADGDSDEGDGSGEPGDDETDSESESDTTGGSGMATCEDEWEPNASAEQASTITWESADEWSAYRDIDDAGLCPGDHDWYHFDVESLSYAEHYLYIRALIKDAGLCGPGCGEPEIPAGPQHAVTVEVYRADDGALLASETDDDGVLVLNGPSGEAYSHDLVIHVFSPTLSAEYPYRLSVSIRNYDGEDECEC
jgi:hypothetical protein